MALRLAVYSVVVLPVWLYLFFTCRRAVTLFVSSRRRAGVWALCISGLLYLMFRGFVLWAMIVLHLVGLLLLTQLINLPLRYLLRGRSARAWRYVYRLGVLPILITAIIFSLGYSNMQRVRRTDYTVPTPKGVSPCTVALISDIHYGDVANAQTVARLVAELNASNLDVAVLCGDITDENTTRAELEEVYSLLGGLKTARGIYFVYGNHDKALYSTSPNYSPAELEACITQNGIRILEDEAAEISEKLYLIGRKDKSAPLRKTPAELTAGIAADCFALMADHQPTAFREKADAGVDLQLSGHTHGGQFFPLGYINTLISSNELCYGKTQLDGMTAIVSSGVSGWGAPIRTQGVSEYVIIAVGEK